MDILLRPVAIFIEVLLLVAIAYSVLEGVKLAVFDLGTGPKYNKAITMVLLAVGVILVFFFIAHLAAFYPPLSK